VVLDLVMPRADGWSFLIARSQDPRMANLPVVVTSGARHAPTDALLLGASACLSKPYDPDALVEVVGHVS
jgi:CheY-like chemotaxis protein